MANRSVYSLLKGIPREAFIAKVQEEAKKCAETPPPGDSRWSDWRYLPKDLERRVSWRGDTATITPGSYALAIALSGKHACPYLELRVQESDHWDFALYDSGEFVVDFSTHGDYWGDAHGTRPLPWRKGDLKTFSRVWGIDGGSIERYFVDWAALPKELIGVEKAYDSDQFPYGNSDQCYDFLERIGGANSWWESDHESFKVAGWESAYRRQPAIRRLIRSLSVRFRGTYPDVPAKTREDRRRLAQTRRETRWLLKHHPEVFVQRYDRE